MFKKYLKWFICILCLIIFIIISINIVTNNILNFDNSFYNFISKYFINDYITPFVKKITFFGSSVCLITLMLLFLTFIKDKRISILIALNLGLNKLINILIKYSVQRPRPADHRLINQSGYSFPSGHSMVSMAFYGFLIYLVYKYVKNKYIKILLIILLSLLIVLIGLSRVYLGVHYMSDVLAGYVISISYLIVFISIINKLIIKEKNL